MSLKEQVQALVEDLPDDSPVLVEMRETLRLNNALREGIEDVRAGRVYSAEEFMAKVEKRWPGTHSK